AITFGGLPCRGKNTLLCLQLLVFDTQLIFLGTQLFVLGSQLLFHDTKLLLQGAPDCELTFDKVLFFEVPSA
ncbi:hypothetical protein C0J52_09330, partial [Blattella germanica]